MLTIVNYGLGNLASVQNMCRRLGIEAQVTADKDLISRSERLILL